MKRPLPDGTTHLLFTGLEACGVPGTSASGKPHEVPRHLRSGRATAAISGPPSRWGGGERSAPPSRCAEGERGAPGSAQQGADGGEDAASRLSPSCSGGRSTSTCSRRKRQKPHPLLA